MDDFYRKNKQTNKQKDTLNETINLQCQTIFMKKKKLARVQLIFLDLTLHNFTS